LVRPLLGPLKRQSTRGPRSRNGAEPRRPPNDRSRKDATVLAAAAPAPAATRAPDVAKAAVPTKNASGGPHRLGDSWGVFAASWDSGE
jgi:hypothetical protein